MLAKVEVRFALRKPQLCSGCHRMIDEEDYTRTVFTQGGMFISITHCRDCRPLY